MMEAFPCPQGSNLSLSHWRFFLKIIIIIIIIIIILYWELNHWCFTTELCSQFFF